MTTGAGSSFIVLLALALAAGCSFGDARVGAAQTACGVDDAGQPPTKPGAAGYYAVGSKTSAAPTCETHGDSACDVCEATHCCTPRSACYSDPVCACADLTLDHCRDDAEAAADAEVDAGVARCWSAFSARGAVERDRVACQRGWCQKECEVP